MTMRPLTLQDIKLPLIYWVKVKDKYEKRKFDARYMQEDFRKYFPKTPLKYCREESMEGFKERLRVFKKMVELREVDFYIDA